MGSSRVSSAMTPIFLPLSFETLSIEALAEVNSAA